MHFGGEDHKRYYGLDFAERLAEAGFAVETFRMPPEREVEFGLLRNDRNLYRPEALTRNSMYLARFSYDVLPINRQRAIDLSAVRSRLPGPGVSTPGCWCR